MNVMSHLTISRRMCIALPFLFFYLGSLSAQGIPFLSGRVNDYASMLSTQVRVDLEQALKDHERESSNQIAVLTISSLEEAALEEYSMMVADAWKLGQKGKDNGVLFLIVRDDRKVRIEVGYGLEGTLTDALCSGIIRNEVVPRFKSGDFDGGIRNGVSAILGVIQGTYNADEESGSSMGPGEKVLFLGIFLVVVGLFTIIAILTKGFMSTFLFVFLIPFWLFFPGSVFGQSAGVSTVALYVLLYLSMKSWFRWSSSGRAFQERWQFRTVDFSRTVSVVSSGWGASSGRSSSGGGFSGGGGSFGGGGSSGSW